jgi:prepilin-type processing-associated H-X9-DG protein/prepilin-type N-terminal cleavage/methylation domain-containing protein
MPVQQLMRAKMNHCFNTPDSSGFTVAASPSKLIHHKKLMNIPILIDKRHRVMRRGITLVEILVVITIIVVLAALSTVGLSRARSAARGGTCTSNLRQLGTAILSYANENGGQLPPLEDRTNPGDGLKGIWPQIIADGGYLPRSTNKKGKLTCSAGVWACPDCTVAQTNYQGYGVAEGTVMKVKKMTEPDAKGSLRLAQIPNPERTWLVGDVADKAPDLKTGWYATWANPASWKARTPAARHSKKVNVCMADGHVESLTVNELRAPEKNYTMYK